MKKFPSRFLVCCIIVLICWFSMLLEDRYSLNNQLIRFHIVANSDSQKDQATKLTVRDVVLNSLNTDLNSVKNMCDAKAYLQENLPKIQNMVNYTLEELGFYGGCKVSFCKEFFDIRHYDTFSLPAGIYHSLRIVIGDGLGQNWWCVSFPSLCMPATTSAFVETAADAGFSEPLVQTLSGNKDYQIRFFFLNQLGKFESIFLQE